MIRIIEYEIIQMILKQWGEALTTTNWNIKTSEFLWHIRIKGNFQLHRSDALCINYTAMLVSPWFLIIALCRKNFHIYKYKNNMFLFTSNVILSWIFASYKCETLHPSQLTFTHWVPGSTRYSFYHYHFVSFIKRASRTYQFYEFSLNHPSVANQAP